MCLPSFGAINKKFFKKAADKVWEMKIPEFDAKTQIPDSLLNTSSAVIIALYDNADINLERTASTNRTEQTMINRVMVKILDKSALDNFSTFEFKESKGRTLKVAGMTLSEYKSAFGARIYKPDGRVIEVDANEALPETTGKKDKIQSYKLPVAGLEIGDVLDYFYYDENWVEEFSIRPMRMDFLHKYPTMVYITSGDIHKDLTVEYRSYNGAPNIVFDAPDGNRRHFEVKTYNLPAAESGLGLLPERQNPFVKMFVTNFSARYEYHPSTSRSSGVYPNLMTGTVYRDILTVLRDARYDSNLPNKVVSAAKNFAKLHPDADDMAIADAAWLALNYYNYIDDADEDDIWIAIMFNDIIKKLKIDKSTSVAFLNSRDDVATNNLISWRQPDYMTLVGDRYYLPGIACRIPGELPGKYQGEEGGTFLGDVTVSRDMMMPSLINAPTTTTKQNQFIRTGKASIEGSDIKLALKTEVSGACKSAVEDALYAEDWIGDVENYLGIPQNKRYNLRAGDAEEHNREREKFLSTDVPIGPDVTPTVNKLEVLSHGICPDAPNYVYTLDCTVSDLVQEAGNDVIVNVGKLFGKNYVLTDREREQRQNDFCFNAPKETRYIISLALPDGFKVKEGSLEALNVNAKTMAGQFFVQAKYNEATNSVDFTSVERYTRYLIGSDYWQEVVKLFDAAAQYNLSTLVLTRM
jgi:hypothetical protein